MADQVMDDLLLKDEQGKPLEIVHENKMQLEWLAADIEKHHGEFIVYMEKVRKRRQLKMKIAIIILLITIVVAIMNHTVASWLSLPLGTLNMMTILIGFFSAWQILQLYLLGSRGGSAALKENLRTLELQELIKKKFSED